MAVSNMLCAKHAMWEASVRTDNLFTLLTGCQFNHQDAQTVHRVLTCHVCPTLRGFVGCWVLMRASQRQIWPPRMELAALYNELAASCIMTDATSASTAPWDSVVLQSGLPVVAFPILKVQGCSISAALERGKQAQVRAVHQGMLLSRLMLQVE